MDSRTIGISVGKEIESFTLDKIFDTKSTQAEIFNFIGKPTIQDVLDGYNGTIFAYGQTGSGKTYTMMGFDIFDEAARGIIPRAANQIFESVNQDDGEIEYTLKCSMLEIYKETIRDLLDSDARALSIKECPRRGIYVQGLTEICITSESDMLEVLTLGETMRTVAATKLNKSSSRSHMIFMLEVLQKLPNDTEKRGILNLVDLAGSEKVSQSGVTGNKLEETKKINFSLSALGNVIHALVSNNDHIPYRDSKLTRLLQESLGGNYKTNLIVACSPFHRCLDETINSLGFAIRAKAIKNKVRINIKNSPENYIKIIEQLKAELTNAKSEISILKEERALTARTNISMNTSLNNSLSIAKHTRQTMSATKIKPKKSNKNFPSIVLSGIENILDEHKEKVNQSSIFESSLALSFHNTSEKISDCETFTDRAFTDREFTSQIRDELEQTMEKMKKKNEMLEEENRRLGDNLKLSQTKLSKSKSKRLKLEQRMHECYESYHKSSILISKESSKNTLLVRQSETLNRQIRRLTQALQEIDSRYKDFIESQTKLEDVTFVEFEDKSEVEEDSEVPVETERRETHSDHTENYNLGLVAKNLCVDAQTLISQSNYTKELRGALENNAELSKDITIYQLKNQVVQAGVINANITRCMHCLDWKINLVNQKYRLKRNLSRHQSEEIKALESMLDNLHASYQRIVKLYEQIPRNPNPSIIDPFVSPNKRIVKPFRSKTRLNTKITKSHPDLILKSTDSHSVVITGSFAESESVIEPSVFFLKYKALETSYNLQLLYNLQLKKTNEELKKQSSQYQKLLEKLESDIFKAQKSERAR